MPERMSLTLVDPSPTTIAMPTLRVMRTPRPASLRGTRGSSGRGHGPSADRRAQTARAIRESVRESLWGSVWDSFVSERVGIERLATSAGVKTRSVETPTHVQKRTFLSSDAPITVCEE